MKLIWIGAITIGGAIVSGATIWLFWKPRSWRKHLAGFGFAMAALGVLSLGIEVVVRTGPNELGLWQQRCTWQELVSLEKCSIRTRPKRRVAASYVFLIGGLVAGLTGIGWRIKEAMRDGAAS